MHYPILLSWLLRPCRLDYPKHQNNLILCCVGKIYVRLALVSVFFIHFIFLFYTKCNNFDAILDLRRLCVIFCYNIIWFELTFELNSLNVADLEQLLSTQIQLEHIIQPIILDVRRNCTCISYWATHFQILTVWTVFVYTKLDVCHMTAVEWLCILLLYSYIQCI